MSDINEPVTTSKKKREPAMPTLISSLETGEDILNHLISKHHHHLASLKILLLCTNKEIKSGGRQKPGKVQKTTPLLKYLTTDARSGKEADVIITVSLPAWNEADNHKRHAMLDHLLTCIETTENEENGELKVQIVSPQVAEFAEVIERYGAYNHDLEDVAAVLRAATKTA